MKLVTWNVNSIGVRLERALAFLERESPDVLCLQELKCTNDKFPIGAFNDAGYHAEIFGQKTYNGVAIISKNKPDNVVKGFGDNHPDEAARFIAATFGSITAMSLYVPNGQEVGSDKYAYKLEWLSRLSSYLAKHHKPSDQLILAGDYNIAPEDVDVHDPDLWRGQILCSDKERAALKELEAFGLSDTFRIHHKEGKLFSWWDYRQLGFQKNHGLRIDLILATKPLADKCKSARIDRDERRGEKPSDHAPVIAEFSP